MGAGRTGAPRGRLLAVDVLRGIALIGIMINHIFGSAMESLLWWDFHAIGFALLIGAGAGLGIPHGQGVAPRAKGVAVARNWVRALVLALVGFALEDLPNGGVAVILVRLAIIVALISLLALLPTRVLPLVGASLLIVTPPLAWRWQVEHPAWFAKDVGWSSVLDGGAWMRMLWAPYHPALLWLGAAVIGLWVVRRFDLAAPLHLARIGGLGAALAAGSAFVSVVAWSVLGRPVRSDLRNLAAGDFPGLLKDDRWLWGVGAYLPSTPSLLFSTGVVLMALALVGLVCRAPAAARGLRWLGIVGAMTFTGYTLHVLAEGQIAAAAAAERFTIEGWPDFALQFGVLAAFLLAWSRLPGRLGKGPLEWLSRWVAGFVR